MPQRPPTEDVGPLDRQLQWGRQLERDRLRTIGPGLNFPGPGAVAAGAPGGPPDENIGAGAAFGGGGEAVPGAAPQNAGPSMAERTKDMAAKGVDTAGKGVQMAGKGAELAGKGAELAGKGAQMAGKGMQMAGKGIDAAGSGMLEAGEGLSGTGLGAIVGVPLMAVGGLTKGVGMGTEAAGHGVEAGGKAAEAGGKAAKQAGKSVGKAGQGMRRAGASLGGMSLPGMGGRGVKQEVKDVQEQAQRLQKMMSGVTGIAEQAGEDAAKGAMNIAMAKDKFAAAEKEAAKGFKNWVVGPAIFSLWTGMVTLGVDMVLLPFKWALVHVYWWLSNLNDKRTVPLNIAEKLSLVVFDFFLGMFILAVLTVMGAIGCIFDSSCRANMGLSVSNLLSFL